MRHKKIIDKTTVSFYINVYLSIIHIITELQMKRVGISLNDEKAVSLVKEAKKKAIDEDLSFSESVLLLLEKWTSGNISISKGAE